MQIAFQFSISKYDFILWISFKISILIAKLEMHKNGQIQYLRFRSGHDQKIMSHPLIQQNIKAMSNVSSIVRFVHPT